MKLKINKACDLASISVLPPRRTRGSGGRASASASAAAASQQRSQTMSQQSFSQSVGASFSQGVGSGGASFSQGRGGGGAPFSQNSGGAPFSQNSGGAPFSQNSGGGGASFSQVGSGGTALSQVGSGCAAFSQGGGGGGAAFSQGGGRGGAAFSQGGGGGGAAFSQGGGGGGAAFSQGGGGGGAFSQGRGAGGAAFSQNSGGGGASFSQVSGGGAAFSQGGGGGGASFSQGSGGGGAAFSQGGSGGSASFSQGVGSASQSQISQASLDENLLSLHHPSPARDQRFALPDDSSKRMASFPANSASVVREESQLQLAKISSNCNPIHRWNPSLPDSRCQMNEDVERKFQHLASSVHKIGMVLDSVQNDVMQLNRAMMEASLDSDSTQKKFVLVENSVQQILKVQDELKALLEGSTKSNPDLLSILNYHTIKLDEISSTLPVLKQVQADLRQLKGDIFRILTKEMEGIVRAIRSSSSRPDPMEMLADRSCTTNEKTMMNRTRAAKGSAQMKERPVADDRPQMKQTPVANGRSQMNQTPVANGRPQMKRTPATNGRPQMNHTQIANGISKMKQAPEANGKPLMKQIPVAKVLPAPLVYQSKVEDLKPKRKKGKLVKAGAQTLVGSSCCRVAPKQEELAIQKVDPQVPTKNAPWSIIIDLHDDDEDEGSDGRASCVILKTATGAGGKLMREEETSEDALEILRRARKRLKREENKAIVLFGQ